MGKENSKDTQTDENGVDPCLMVINGQSRDVYTEICDIKDALRDLEARGAREAGFSGRLDYAFKRVAALEERYEASMHKKSA